MGEIGQFNLVGSVWWVEFIKLCVVVVRTRGSGGFSPPPPPARAFWL